jgi:two-component system cell cycle response regulator DivK
MPEDEQRRFRVLIVEDFDDARELYCVYFQLQGFEAHPAADGIAALRAARLIRPDAIVLDVALPRLDGFSVLREVRADPQLSATPVLMLSATDDPDYAARCKALGANGALTKPCLPEELVEEVRAQLLKRAVG